MHPEGTSADPCVCVCPPSTCAPDEEQNLDDCSCIPIISHPTDEASSSGTSKGIVAGAILGAAALVAIVAAAAVFGARAASSRGVGADGAPLLDPLVGNSTNNPLYASPIVEGVNPFYSGSS
jgi:hypothetical protein